MAGGSSECIHLGNFSNSIPTVRIPTYWCEAHLPTIARANLTAGTTEMQLFFYWESMS